MPPLLTHGSGPANRNQSALRMYHWKTTLSGGFDAGGDDVFGGKRRRWSRHGGPSVATRKIEAIPVVSLLAEMARNYIELRGCSSGSFITRDNIKSHQDAPSHQHDSKAVSPVSWM